MSNSAHWDGVYTRKAGDAVSWYQPEATRALARIAATGIDCDAPLIDVGCGASVLIDTLLDAGYTGVSALDLSVSAIAALQQRLGERAAAVQWLVGDITALGLPDAGYALWHDRAVFHFLTAPAARDAYVAAAARALRPGGHLLLSTFADDGPESCSGLPVQRYSAAALAATFAAAFDSVADEKETHRTPWGSEQRFVSVWLRRR
jgi:SAM-dependent methyltransferase